MCTRAGSTPRGSSASGSLPGALRVAARRRQFRCLYSDGAPDPLVGFGAPSRDSPALQRIEGADALLIRAKSSFARLSSLSEVLHRP